MIPPFHKLADELDKALAKDKQRIAEMTAMMEEAMAIFDRYLNVPESVELRKRWEALKNELGLQKLSNQAEPEG